MTAIADALHPYRLPLAVAAITTALLIAVAITVQLAAAIRDRLADRQETEVRRLTAPTVEHIGADENWSPAEDVGAQEQAPELLLIQTSADKAAAADELAHPIPADSAAIIDAALAAIRAACDRGFAAILPGDEFAELRAYYLRAEMHRNPDHTPSETASMQFRKQLDAMLAADGRDELAGAVK